MYLHVRTRTSIFHLANGLEDRVEIWCVARDPFDESYTGQMWAASARAHVHTPFARWCIRGRSFIHKVVIVLPVYIISNS